MFSLAHPSALWGLLVVPVVVVALALDGLFRRRLLERIGHLPQVQRMIASLDPARRRWKALLYTVAVGLLVVGVAGPETSGRARLAPRRGLDIVVALDFSRSMLATDVYPSRLERARRELDKLIDGLKGDRVGLVAFAGVTLSYPLTSDYAAAKLFWRDLGPDDIPIGGSHLGAAIKAGLELLEHGSDRRPRPGVRPPAQVLVLLTDGADTEGTALEMAARAKAAGVKIYTVGIGTVAGEFVALKRSGDGTAEYIEAEGKPVRMQLDMVALRQLAEATGGDYFQLDPERLGVERVQRAIAKLERREEEARVVQEPEPAYPWIAFAALLVLALESLLGDRKRPRAMIAAATAGQTAALLLAMLVPGLVGFDWFERPDPDVESGNRLLVAGKAAEALSAYERALARLPDDPGLHYNRGAALYALGRLPEAQREFERTAEVPDPALRGDALYNLGNTLLKQERAKEALVAYKRALNLNPDDHRAKWNLELALRRLREQERQKKQQQAGEKPPPEPKPDEPKPAEQKPAEQKPAEQKPAEQKPGEQKPGEQKPNPEEGDGKQDAQRQDAQRQEAQRQEAQRQEAQRQDAQKQDAQKQDAQKQDAQKQDAQKQDAQKQDAQKQEPTPAKPDPARAAAAPPATEAKTPPGPGDGRAADGVPARAVREIDRQDAAAILDAFERVEPTVQKEIARRKAGNRRPTRDW